MVFTYTLSNGTLADADQVMTDFNQLPIKGDSNTITGVWEFNNPTIRSSGVTASVLVISSTSTSTTAALSLQRANVEKWQLLNNQSTNDLTIYDNTSNTARLLFNSNAATMTIGQTAIYRGSLLDNQFANRTTLVAAGSASSSATAYTVFLGVTAATGSFSSEDIMEGWITYEGGSTGMDVNSVILSDGTNAITLASTKIPKVAANRFEIDYFTGRWLSNSANSFVMRLNAGTAAGGLNFAGQIGVTVEARKNGATGPFYAAVKLLRGGRSLN